MQLRNMLDAKQEVSMVYVFEFFTVEPDGNRLLLEITKHRAKTKDLAHAHGDSMMRNVVFGDQKYLSGVRRRIARAAALRRRSL